MDNREPDDDGEIVKLDSIPPGDDDDAYAAPTKVGEAAYKMLARRMSVEPPAGAPTASAPPPVPRPAVPNSPSSRPTAETKRPPPPSRSAPPVRAYGDDADTETGEQLATVLIPSSVSGVAKAGSPLLSGVPSAPPPAASLAPASPPARVPIPYELPVAQSESRWRTELVIGVVSFLVIAVPALIYFALR